MEKPRIRAEVVGSLLQPDALVTAREQHAKGSISDDDLKMAEDAAVDFCIRLQEGVGVDVVTDGEMRRTGWASMTQSLDGVEPRTTVRSYPASVHQTDPMIAAAIPTVVRRVSQKADKAPGAEFQYLQSHTDSFAKFTIPAPSYYRRFWSDELSMDAYPDCESYLLDVRDWTRGIIEELVSNGCPYIQLDAPNYGSLCDADNRAFHESIGHDLVAQVAFDGDLDSSAVQGLDTVTAIHVCRGNWLEATWSRGGYEVIAEQLFPRLDFDAVLLEYDSERAGDFGPIGLIPDGTTVVLGTITTKSGRMETLGDIEQQLATASRFKDVQELAISTQCGFSSSAFNNNLSFEDQRAKLQLVATAGHSFWS